jgi:putative transposase
MDERLRFVARLVDGEKMARLCREFEISRKTGYKIFSRYKDCGVEGLTDRSRRPYRHARQLPFQIEKAIIQFKQAHPCWGAPKIRERLRRKHSELQCPAISTVHAILDRNGLVKRRRRRRDKPEGTSLSGPSAPNDLWCADYKGEFMLADRRYCYPLTITDCALQFVQFLVQGPVDNPDTFIGMYQFWVQKPNSKRSRRPTGATGRESCKVSKRR